MVTPAASISLLFLGTGTSAGVPMIGCHCRVCTSEDPRDRRHRASVVVSYGGHHVLVDTTPDLRVQCLEHRVDRVDTLVYTHAHADHIMGMDDMRRFNAITGRTIDAWMDDATHRTIDRVFGYALREPVEADVLRPRLMPRLYTGPFEIAGLTWTPVPLHHGEAMISGFRVGDLAYCTDASGIPPESMALLHGLDVLVLDALQPVKHPTHFSIAEALEVVGRLRPRRAFLTHMSHRVMHADIERDFPPHVRLAYDGLRVSSPQCDQ